jgi:hypothetical protein
MYGLDGGSGIEWIVREHLSAQTSGDAQRVHRRAQLCDMG